MSKNRDAKQVRKHGRNHNREAYREEGFFNGIVEPIGEQAAYKPVKGKKSKKASKSKIK